MLDLLAAHDAPWKRDALCREPERRPTFLRTLDHRGKPDPRNRSQDPDEAERGAVRLAFQEAVLTCRRCLVRDECYAEALRLRPRTGVWAGYTALQLGDRAKRGQLTP